MQFHGPWSTIEDGQMGPRSELLCMLDEGCSSWDMVEERHESHTSFGKELIGLISHWVARYVLSYSRSKVGAAKLRQLGDHPLDTGGTHGWHTKITILGRSYRRADLFLLLHSAQCQNTLLYERSSTPTSLIFN